MTGVGLLEVTQLAAGMCVSRGVESGHSVKVPSTFSLLPTKYLITWEFKQEEREGFLAASIRSSVQLTDAASSKAASWTGPAQAGPESCSIFL